MASEYEASVIASLEAGHAVYIEVYDECCKFWPAIQGDDAVRLTREQMYKLSDEIRAIANDMEFLTCDGSENE